MLPKVLIKYWVFDKIVYHIVESQPLETNGDLETNPSVAARSCYFSRAIFTAKFPCANYRPSLKYSEHQSQTTVIKIRIQNKTVNKQSQNRNCRNFKALYVQSSLRAWVRIPSVVIFPIFIEDFIADIFEDSRKRILILYFSDGFAPCVHAVFT